MRSWWRRIGSAVNVPYMSLVFVVLGGMSVWSQTSSVGIRAFSGPNDTGIAVPVAVEKLGYKPAAALQVLNASAASAELFKDQDLEFKGTMTRGSGDHAESIPVTVVVGSNGRFRMTLTERDGDHEFRAIGSHGQARRKTGEKVRTQLSQFGMPLAVPLQIASLASGENVSLRQDGEQIINGSALRVITMTIRPTSPGETSTASLYFDKEASHLRKMAIVSTTHAYRPLKTLEVTSYGRFKQVHGAWVPFECEITRDGLFEYSVHIDSVEVLTRHDDSFFQY